MGSEIRKYLGVFLQLQKIGIMRKMAYPASFFSLLFTVLLSMSTNVAFFRVTFQYVNSIVGWNFYQIMTVVGSFMIIDGLSWVLFANMNAFSSHIKEGSFDGLLTKPIDVQFFVTFFRGDFEDSVRIISGLFLIFFATRNIASPGLLNILFYLFALISGFIIYYSFNIFLRCFSFWTVEGAGIWLLMEKIMVNSQYPTDIYYQKIVKVFFTFVIPITFMATVPAKILTNKNIDFPLVGLSFLITLIFFVGARLFWKFSLKHYSSASS